MDDLARQLQARQESRCDKRELRDDPGKETKSDKRELRDDPGKETKSDKRELRDDPGKETKSDKWELIDGPAKETRRCELEQHKKKLQEMREHVRNKRELRDGPAIKTRRRKLEPQHKNHSQKVLELLRRKLEQQKKKLQEMREHVSDKWELIDGPAKETKRHDLELDEKQLQEMQERLRSIAERKEQHMQEREREEEQHSTKRRRRQQSTPDRVAQVPLTTRTCRKSCSNAEGPEGQQPLFFSGPACDSPDPVLLIDIERSRSRASLGPSAFPQPHMQSASPTGKGLQISVASEPGHSGPSSVFFSGGSLASGVLSRGNVASNVSGSPNCDEPLLRSVWTENCGDYSVHNDAENTPQVWASSYDIHNTSVVHPLLPELKATNLVESNEHTEHSEQPFFSKRWQFEQAFSCSGGNLQGGNSDIILVIPEAAVRQCSNIVIKGAVSTNLERVHRDLDMREDERIVSAVIEYTACPDAVFEKPVTISIPHFIPGNPPYDRVSVYWFYKDGSGFHVQKLKWQMSEETKGDTDTGPDNGVFRLNGSDRIEVLVTHFCGFVCTHCGESSPQLQLRLYGSPCGRNDKDVKIFLLVWDKRLDSKDFRENIVQKPEEDQKYILTQTITDVPENANDLKLGAILIMEPQYKLVWMHKLRPDGVSPWYPAKQEIDLRKYSPSCMKSSPKRLEWLLTRRKMTAPTFECFIEVGFFAAEEENSTFLDGLDIATLHIEHIKLRADKLLASCCTQTEKYLIQKNQAESSTAHTDQFAFDQPSSSRQTQAISSINGQLHEHQVKQPCQDVRPKVRDVKSTSDPHDSHRPQTNNAWMGNRMLETTQSPEIQQYNNNNQKSLSLACAASSSQTQKKSVHSGSGRESAESEDEKCNTSSGMNGNSQWQIVCGQDGKEMECSRNWTLLDSARASAVASEQSSPAGAHINIGSGHSPQLLPFPAFRRPQDLTRHNEQDIQGQDGSLPPGCPAVLQYVVNHINVNTDKIIGNSVHFGSKSISPAPGTASSNVQHPANAALTNCDCETNDMRRLALNSPNSYHNSEMMPSTSGPQEEAMQQEHHQPTAGPSRGLCELTRFSFSPAVQCSDSSSNNTCQQV